MALGIKEQNRNRAGAYVRQSTGYSAFIPNALPPNPPIDIDQEMQTLLSRADRALGRLDGSIQTLPNPDLFVFMYVRKEAVLSSQIEGTQSSISDILKVEAHVFDPRRPADVGEVLNYVEAMNYGLQRLEELPLSRRLIQEIHYHLLSEVRGNELQPGEIRRTQNWIGPAGCTLKDAIYVPPPPNDAEEALSDLEKFMHEPVDVPHLIKIGMIHAQFETIHPFLDGNGRVGRLLITFMLCHDKILSLPVLYLSHFLKQNRREYYQLLQNIRENGDWESWIKFFLQGIHIVSNEATETAREIVSLREASRELITSNFGRAAGNGLVILEKLFRQPFVKVQEVSEELEITFQAANNLVGRFVDEEILEEITGQARNRVYRYTNYIDLFSDN